MNERERRKLMIDLGLTQDDLRKRMRIKASKQTISATILGTRASPRIRREIARVLEYSYETIWGTPDPEAMEAGNHVDVDTSTSNHDGSDS